VLDNQNGDGGVPEGSWTFHGWDRVSARKFRSVGTELRPRDAATAGHSNGLKYSQVSLGNSILKTLTKVKSNSASCDSLKNTHINLWGLHQICRLCTKFVGFAHQICGVCTKHNCKDFPFLE